MVLMLLKGVLRKQEISVKRVMELLLGKNKKNDMIVYISDLKSNNYSNISFGILNIHELF